MENVSPPDDPAMLPSPIKPLPSLAPTRLIEGFICLCALLFIPCASAQPVPVTVRSVAADDTPIRLWLGAEGTATAIRREFLWFDRGGRVVEIGQDEHGDTLREGSWVRGPRGKGQPGQFIARLDGRSQNEQIEQQRARARAAERRVVSARNAVLATQKQYESAVAQLERSQQLAERGMIQKQRLAQDESTVALFALQINSREAELAAAVAEAEAANSGASQALLASEGGVLFAPFDGVLGFFNLREGEQALPPPGAAASAGQRMRSAAAVLIDPTAYEITLELPAYEGALVRRGQDAELTWAGLGRFDGDGPGTVPVIKAVVHAVNAAVSPDSRSVKVRLRAEDSGKFLRDGAFVAARIATGDHPVRAAIPLRAVRFEQGAAYVFVLNAEGNRVERRAVRTGRADGRRVEILDGLQAGERVVSEGHHRLAHGTAVSLLEGPN